MLFCGLDFGTSNTCACLAVDSKGKGAASTIESSFPSLLFFPEGNAFSPHIGREAITAYEHSKQQGRFFQSIKSVLADASLESTMVHREEYTVAQLVSLILKRAKNALESKVGRDVDGVVLGKPVVFVRNEKDDSIAEERLHIAARLAGFRRIEFRLEPIAAAFAYETNLKREELVLVVDLGGGTSDFSVARLGPSRKHKNNRKKDILAVTGVDVGGNNFDGRLLWEKGVPHLGYGSFWGGGGRPLELPVHIFRDLCDWETFPFLKRRHILSFLEDARRSSNHPAQVEALINVIRNNLGYSLFRACERTKVAANENGSGTFAFRVDKHHWNEPITRDSFVCFSSDLFDRISDKASQCIRDAGIAPEAIDRVFLTGGSSLLFEIQHRFRKTFGERVITGDMFLSVARGLSITNLI